MHLAVLCISCFFDTPPIAFAATIPAARVCCELPTPHRHGLCIGDAVVVRMRRDEATGHLSRWCVEVSGHQLPPELLEVTRWWWECSHPLHDALQLELRATDLAFPLPLPLAFCEQLVVLDLSGSELVRVSAYNDPAHGDIDVEFRSLKVLRLNGCYRLRGLSVFQRCPALTTLDTAETTLADLNWLGALGALQEANLGPAAQLVDVAALRSATALTYLGLAASGVSSLDFLTERHTTLRVVDVSHCAGLAHWDGLAGKPLLHDLVATGSAVERLGDLHLCPNLTRLVVDRCAALTSLDGLGGAPHLTHLSAKSTNLTTLDGLAQCPCLEEVNVTFCTNLESVSGLAGAPRLRKLVAWSSRLADLAGLEQCPLLEEVNVEFCDAVTSLVPLGQCRWLRRVLAGRTPLVGLADLGWSATLNELHVTSCKFLHTPEAINGAAALTVFNAEFSGLEDVNGLGACPSLTEVNVSYCSSLTNLDGLRYCPSLRVLRLRSTMITTLNPIESSVALEDLTVSRCPNLVDFSALTQLPALRKLSAQALSLADGAGQWLALCPQVEDLDLGECTGITDLSILGTYASLRHLRVWQTGLDNVHFVRACVLLTELNVGGCLALVTLSPFANHPSIARIHAAQTGLTDVEGLASCAKLELLNVRECPQLTVDCVARLHLERPYIQIHYTRPEAVVTDSE